MKTIEDIKRLIPENYREGFNIRKFFQSFIDKFNYDDDQIEVLKKSLQIDYAKGKDLELLGEILQIGRNLNESDTNYRNRIKAYIGTVSVRTTKEAFKKILEGIGLTSSDYNITESQSKVTIYIYALLDSSSKKNLTIAFDIVKSAGKKVILLITSKTKETVNISDSDLIASVDNYVRTENSKVENGYLVV